VYSRRRRSGWHVARARTTLKVVNARTKHVLVEALELPNDERAALAEELLASLHEPDPDVERAWAAVIAERIKDVTERGVTGPECRPFLKDLVERLRRGE
jgi:hypothetical protein